MTEKNLLDYDDNPRWFKLGAADLIAIQVGLKLYQEKIMEESSIDTQEGDIPDVEHLSKLIDYLV